MGTIATCYRGVAKSVSNTALEEVDSGPDMLHLLTKDYGDISMRSVSNEGLCEVMEWAHDAEEQGFGQLSTIRAK